MKKILLIATTPLNVDGITKVEMDTIKYNSSLVKFEVACGYGFNNRYGQELEEKGITCINLPKKKSLFRYMFDICKIVKKGNYDVVYVHGNSALMAFEAVPAKIGGTKYLITHCHNTKTDYPIVHNMIKPLFNKIVDLKLACSSDAARWAYNGKNVKIILNGVDISKYRFNKAIREQYRKQLNLEEMHVIGHVGRFNKQKNHKKVIDIFAEIYNRDSSARLMLIGDGELKEEIKDYVEERGLSEKVLFLGSVSNVFDYYQAMDGVLLPSLHEGMCIVALEVQANGMPILLSNTCTEETFATSNAYALSIREEDVIWAEKMINTLAMGRRDCTDQLIEKGLNIETTMTKIRGVLLENE